MLFSLFLWLSVNIVLLDGLGMYHVGSKVEFHPCGGGEYFGYSIVISNGSIIVGAPKALSRQSTPVASGLIFKCLLPKSGIKKVNCKPMALEMPVLGDTGYIKNEKHDFEFYKEGMWLGASMETISDERIVVCAPRYTKNYSAPLTNNIKKTKDMVLGVGICYIGSGQSRTRNYVLAPMSDPNNVHFVPSFHNLNIRTEFGPNILFYAYAEVGMSVAVTKKNTLVFGAPGSLKWAGSIAEYAILHESDGFVKKVVLNPYYTKAISRDEYFGYTVESGNFEGNESTKVYYVAGAPRSAKGNGQVFIFEPPTFGRESLKIHYSVKGSQLGAYFGGSVRCPDLNADGYPDLVVGAPNYVIKGETLGYDHGAAFVYINKAEVPLQFSEPVMLTGSGSVGARFGTSIADLGDIDGDGFNDIAIGAPYEDSGEGAVYIYKGGQNGITTVAVQKIVAENSLGFGIAIAKGYDFDNNQCNDVVVGAFKSSSIYLYSCIPSLKVKATINAKKNIAWFKNSSNFTAVFCIKVYPSKWVQRKIDLKGKIDLDGKSNRAHLTDGDEFSVQVKQGSTLCKKKIIQIMPKADLSKPIYLSLTLEPIYELKDYSKTFNSSATRLSKDSKLTDVNHINLIRDCRSDICKPLLHLNLTSLNSAPYVPGSDGILGVKVTVTNKADPAFNAKVCLQLPLDPKRIPESCTFSKLNLTCNLPSPLERDNQASWEIELQYVQTDDETKEVKVIAKVYDEFYSSDSFDNTQENLTLVIKPEINMFFSGKTLPNDTILVLRHRLYEETVSFVHYYKILNYGPSDLKILEFTVIFPNEVNIHHPPKECARVNKTLRCITSAPAKVSRQVIFVLKIDLKEYGNLLKEFGDLNLTTLIENKYSKGVNITTRLVLEPPAPMWPIVVGVVAGLMILAAFVCILYKLNFFLRTNKEKLKQLQDDFGVKDSCSNHESPGGIDNSSTEFIEFD